MTLFGGVKFAMDKGFPIIVKKDDSVVQIENPEAFTPGKWTGVEAGKGSPFLSSQKQEMADGIVLPVNLAD